jgi:hypothetical protein
MKGHQSFMVSDGVGLAELATYDVESKYHSGLLKENKDAHDSMHVSPKQILMLMTFDKCHGL